MNFFRFIADLLHLVSFVLLIQKIKKSSNCLGISYRTQEIYLVVFLSRYWDLFLYYVSLYNTTMKILYIASTAYTIYLMRYRRPQCLTYDARNDSLPHYYIIYPAAAVLALLIHSEFGFFELSWSFSIWLEAIAIVPQLYMVRKLKEVENITGDYMAALGFYRLFYIFNWIWRYIVEGQVSWTQILGGTLQTVIYADFLYIYLTSKRNATSIPLPV